MLYGFESNKETETIVNSSFWNQSNNWGFNMVLSEDWTVVSQINFLKNCTQFKKIGVLLHSSTEPKDNIGISGMYALPDEPIDATLTNNASYNVNDFHIIDGKIETKNFNALSKLLCSALLL